jgi:hypothetical protein
LLVEDDAGKFGVSVFPRVDGLWFFAVNIAEYINRDQVDVEVVLYSGVRGHGFLVWRG